jgi:hypothetical protein
VEPLFYVPIVPMVLINGIWDWTGFSTCIPSFHCEVVANTRRAAMGQTLAAALTPWAAFTGNITADEASSTAARPSQVVVARHSRRASPRDRGDRTAYRCVD